jgi:uncharacterized membrane protein
VVTHVEGGGRQKPPSPDIFERILAVGAIVLLAAVATAVARGRAEWDDVPGNIWLHIATISVAVALTPIMLCRRRGDRLHRQLGWVWTIAMMLTALVSFDIRTIEQGAFSWIHVLSIWTLFQVPLIVWSARTHNVVRHRSAVRGMVAGALLIAGFFTFPFDRLLGHWLFS